MTTRPAASTSSARRCSRRFARSPRMPGMTAPSSPASCSTATTRRMGFNAQTEKYENLVQAGVIDPTKVVRTALQDAASVAGLLITTEAAVSELPEDKPPMPAWPAAAWAGWAEWTSKSNRSSPEQKRRGRRATSGLFFAHDSNCSRQQSGFCLSICPLPRCRGALKLSLWNYAFCSFQWHWLLLPQCSLTGIRKRAPGKSP